MAMQYKNKTIALGMRTWKTILSITVCLFLSRFVFKWGSPVIMILAAVFTMQNTKEDSIENTKIRIIGCIFGAIIAAFGTLFYYYFGYSIAHEMFVIPIGSLLVIITITLFDYPRGIAMGIATFLTIILQEGATASIQYALLRVIDTMVGCFVSVIINNYVFPYKTPSIQTTIQAPKETEDTPDTAKEAEQPKDVN